MKTKGLALFLLLLLTCLMSSCYDAVEVDDITYVITIGMDVGVTDKLRLTLQFPTMQGQTGGGSGGGGGNSDSGYDHITIDVPSFFTGINMINSTIPRELNFEHVSFLVFSEELARSGQAGEYIMALVRFPQIRKDNHIIVCRGSTVDFIKANQPYVGSTLTKTMEILATEAERTAFFRHSTLDTFYKSMKSGEDMPLAILGAVNDFSGLQNKTGTIPEPLFKNGGEYYAGELPREGGSSIELMGAAVFDGDIMITELNGHENRLMMLTLGELKQAYFNVQDPTNSKLVVPLGIMQEKPPSIQVDVTGDTPKINVVLHLNGQILAVQSRYNYENPENMLILENAFQQYLLNELQNFYQKCLQERMDIFRFGSTAIRHFPTIQEWEAYRWREKFPSAQITVDVEFDITRTGSMIGDSPIYFREGKDK